MRWLRPDLVPKDTLRVRLTLWNTAVVLAMAAAALFAVNIGAHAALLREADTVLHGEMNEIELAVRKLHPDTEAVVEVLRRKADSHESRGWFTQILTEDGHTAWRSDRCPEAVASYPPTATDRDEVVVQLGNWRYLRRRLYFPDGGPLRVRIGMSTDSIDSSVNALMRLLVPVGLAIGILTPIAGYLLAVRATKPVGDILRTAAKLWPTRLADRLAVRGTGDELDRLAATINTLLDQVADHVESQERFVADAAHELRGPLTAVRASLEVALSQNRRAGEYRETLVEVLEETNQLSKLANDLLLLAESTDPSMTIRTTAVDLADLARRSVAMFAGVAEERGVAIEAPGPTSLFVAADGAKLRQLIGNLLDNAVRFTPNGGRVVVGVERGSATGEAVLTVADTGHGIGPDDLPRIFDRFYKTDLARSRDDRGRSGGLGLAICKALVEGHGGRITIKSDPGCGTTITCRFPGRQPVATAEPVGMLEPRAFAQPTGAR
jgi:heavy metal sensor kinase